MKRQKAKLAYIKFAMQYDAKPKDIFVSIQKLKRIRESAIALESFES